MGFWRVLRGLCVVAGTAQQGAELPLEWRLLLPIPPELASCCLAWVVLCVCGGARYSASALPAAAHSEFSFSVGLTWGGAQNSAQSRTAPAAERRLPANAATATHSPVFPYLRIPAHCQLPQGMRNTQQTRKQGANLGARDSQGIRSRHAILGANLEAQDPRGIHSRLVQSPRILAVVCLPVAPTIPCAHEMLNTSPAFGVRFTATTHGPIQGIHAQSAQHSSSGSTGPSHAQTRG